MQTVILEVQRFLEWEEQLWDNGRRMNGLVAEGCQEQAMPMAEEAAGLMMLVMIIILISITPGG